MMKRVPTRWFGLVSSATVLSLLVLTAGSLPADGPETTATPRTARLAFTGDILPHLPVVKFARYYARRTHSQGSSASIVEPPQMYRTWVEPIDREYNFLPMFEQVARQLRDADIAICHLETTISSRSPAGYPRFRAPAELVEAIAESGWDGCSLASNHAFDYGVDGVAQTVGAMQQSGLAFAGAATEEGSPRAAHYEANGIRVGHLSYTYGLNGLKLPRSQSWWVNLIDVDTIALDAAVARAEGAEFVVASLHWGTEHQHLPNVYQQQIAQALAEVGAVDLVIGHHAHVLQPVTRIDGLWVVYGLGNFLSNQVRPPNEDGVILFVEIGDGPDGVGVTSITYNPTWVDRNVMQVVAVTNRLLDPDLDHQRQAELRRSWQRTVNAIGALGGHQEGVRPIGAPPRSG